MNDKWEAVRNILQDKLTLGTFKVWIKPLQASISDKCVNIYAPNDFVASRVDELLSFEIKNAIKEVFSEEYSLKISVFKHDYAAPKTEKASATPKSIVVSDKLYVENSSKNTQSFLTTSTLTNSNCSASKSITNHKSDDNGFVSYPSSSGYSTKSSAQHLVEASIEDSRKRLANYTSSKQQQLNLPFQLTTRQQNKSWKYTFSDFVVGDFNELAYAAAKHMTKDSMATDTLFLSSASGLGKTHLTQAVGYELYNHGSSSKKVEYLTAEEFSASFRHAIASNESDRFRTRFRELDILILEDIENLKSKVKTQEELLSTMKALHNRGSRVILTSSFNPNELKSLDSTLVSRFCSGFMADITKPDFEMRRKILLEKAKLKQVKVQDTIIDLLADKLVYDVRQLESCLYNIILQAELLGREITLDMAREVLAKCVGYNTSLTDFEHIVEKICKVFNLSINQIKSRNRKQDYVLARNTIFFLARQHTDLSLQEIGDFFNKRHSTVIKGIANIEKEMKNESPLGNQISNIISRVSR